MPGTCTCTYLMTVIDMRAAVAWFVKDKKCTKSLLSDIYYITSVAPTFDCFETTSDKLFALHNVYPEPRGRGNQIKILTPSIATQTPDL